MQVHSSAPTRLDLAGGTLDIWPLYLLHDGAQTVNVAISLRAECSVSASGDGAWHLVFEDTGEALALKRLDETPPTPERFALAVCLLQHFHPDPVVLSMRAAAPRGAGLAGSSAMAIAACAALSTATHTEYTPESLMALALNLEARVLRVPTGVQDYRPAAYGGIAAIEMGPTGVTRQPLAVDPGELEARLVLAYTGDSRNSGLNNWVVTKQHLDGDKTTITLLDDIRDTARQMRQALEAADWSAAGHALGEEWALRQRLAPGVTTPRIDDLIARGCDAGAYAGKVCGAGGGGCIVLLAEPDVRPQVHEAIREAGATMLPTSIARDGLRVDT